MAGQNRPVDKLDGKVRPGQQTFGHHPARSCQAPFARPAVDDPHSRLSTSTIQRSEADVGSHLRADT